MADQTRQIPADEKKTTAWIVALTIIINAIIDEWKFTLPSLPSNRVLLARKAFCSHVYWDSFRHLVNALASSYTQSLAKLPSSA